MDNTILIVTVIVRWRAVSSSAGTAGWVRTGSIGAVVTGGAANWNDAVCILISGCLRRILLVGIAFNGDGRSMSRAGLGWSNVAGIVCFGAAAFWQMHTDFGAGRRTGGRSQKSGLITDLYSHMGIAGISWNGTGCKIFGHHLGTAGICVTQAADSEFT